AHHIIKVRVATKFFCHTCSYNSGYLLMSEDHRVSARAGM
ncbi:38986_t:CDS:1, partial [Gigaspora margarita]